LSDMDVILFKFRTTGSVTIMNGDFRFQEQNCSSLKGGQYHRGSFTALYGR